MGPNPNTLVSHEAWLKASPEQYQEWRLEDLAKSYRANLDSYDAKSKQLAVAIAATAAEVLLLTLALLAGA